MYFRDIFSVLQQPDMFSLLCDTLVNHSKTISPSIECVTALDSRGFLFGPLLALQLKVPFVPIRKKGKLPGKLTSVSYKLEYGEDVLEMQSDSIKPNQKVLIVDDLLATGGSLGAACKLIQEAGGVVVECLVVMELLGLKGRSNVPAPVHSLLKYD